MAEQTPADGRVSILNVGTKILLKDSMDQYIRTLGDYKTHYASTMASALRAYSGNPIQILLTELDLEDGSAYRLIQTIGGAGGDDLYVILALQEKKPELLALADELEVQSVLIKPFAASDIKYQIEKYKAWKALPKEPWYELVQKGAMAIREKKYSEVEALYKEAIFVAGTNPRPYVKAAKYYVWKADYPMAEKLYKKAIELKGDFVPALAGLASLYMIKREFDFAGEYFRRAHKLSPYNPDRLIEMVKMNIEKSMDLCRESLRLEPNGIAARHTLGKLLAFQKDYPSTVRELERILPVVRDQLREEVLTLMALARKLGGIAK